jgi:hypothetical protein
VADTAGNSYTIKFSRPSTVNAYVEVTVGELAGSYPADGDDQIKALIVAAGDALILGRDLVPSLIASWIVYQTTAAGLVVGIPGVLDATVRVHTTGSFQGTPIVLSQRQRAAYDTSRITIIGTSGSP